ncbi:MAG: carbohydrate porin [Methylacidiphilales bacterium]|nr:carbohydrate porin [Candidatus Methylacidiphilales bacterium]
MNWSIAPSCFPLGKINTRICFIIGLFLTVQAPGWAGTDTPDAVNEKQPAPAIRQVEPNFLNQPYLFGDWGGTRTQLAEQGVVFALNNIGDWQTDVSGNQQHHMTYNGRFRGIVDIDFKKLADVDGEFFFTALWQYGQNNTVPYPKDNTFVSPYGVTTFTSSVGGEESERIDQLWYQQGFADSKFKVKIGQVAASSEFGATDYFDTFVNDELAYAPSAIFNIRQPFSPAGKPGIVLTGDLSDLTPGLYTKAGAFTAYYNPYHPDSKGVDYADDFEHGMTAAFEIGYNEPNKEYPGLYKIGANGNELSYMNPSTGKIYRNDYNLYGVIEKTVYHPTGPDGSLQTKKGLDLLFQSIGAPGDRNPIEFEFSAGGRYTGLIPGRDADKLAFGAVHSEIGGAFRKYYRSLTGHGLGSETTLELGYQYIVTPWFAIQPDAQLIVDPGGDASRGDILILGLRTIVQF